MSSTIIVKYRLNCIDLAYSYPIKFATVKIVAGSETFPNQKLNTSVKPFSINITVCACKRLTT